MTILTKADNWLTPARAAVIAFCFIVVAHYFQLLLWGVDVPMADQWDAEAEWYKKMLTGTNDWQSLIAPHNEHRIAFTRLFNWLVFKLANGWHPLLVAYAQVPLFAGTVAFFAYLLARRTGGLRVFSLVMTLLVFCLPYSWSNILSGFQNPFYFMLLFGVVAIFLAAQSESFAGLSSAVLFAVLSPFTMAGGIATIAVVMALLIFRLLIKKITWWFAAFLLPVIVSGAIWHAKHLVHVAGHDALRAQSALEFVTSTLKIMGWPQVPIGYILWAAMLFGLIRSAKAAGTIHNWLNNLTGAQVFIFGMLVWLLLQIAATSLTRTHADLMSSRYQQIFALSVPLFFLFMQVFELPAVSRRVVTILTLVFILGLAVRTGKEWPYMVKGVTDARFARTAIVDAYLRQSFLQLKAQDKNGVLGYFNAERIWEQIKHPALENYHLWLH